MDENLEFHAGADFRNLLDNLSAANREFLMLFIQGKKITDLFVRLGQDGTIAEIKLKHIADATKRVSEHWKQYANSPSLHQIGGHIEDIGKKTEEASNKTKELLLSWHSLIRLFGVQILHQVVSGLVRNLKEGVKTAQELQKRIGEIQTISQDKPLLTGEWTSGLRKISDMWGLDILEQAEAAYQTLSNQVAKGSETLTFLGEANKFAVTTVSSTSDAVNLLTAALNAFDIDASQTSKVAASFFKTIELGRVRASEMGQTFGRIAVPAHQLGITLDELNAAVATGTIQGVKYSEVTTLIRNILLKLIRPTDEMKKFFRELGVNTGEAAIQAYGFQGMLAKLEEKAHGSATELGELFGRIRSITGAMLFSGKGLQIYSEDLDKITKSQKSYNEATQYIMEKAGKKLEIEMNKIKNFFLVDLGDTILTTLSDISGGFDGLIDVVKQFAETIVYIAVPALVLLSAKFAKLIKAHPYAAAIAGISFLVTSIRGTFAEIDRLEEESKEEWVKFYKEGRELRNKVWAEQSAKIDDYLTKIESAYTEETAIVRKELYKQMDIQDEKFETIHKKMQDYNRDVLNNIKNQVKETEEAIKTLDKSIERSHKSIRTLMMDANTKMFAWDIQDLSLGSKTKAISKMLQVLAKESLKAVDLGDIEQFERLSKERLNLIEEQRDLQRKANAEDLKAKEKTITLTNKRKELETDYQSDRKKLESQLIILEKENATEKSKLTIKQRIDDLDEKYREKLKDIKNSLSEITQYNLKQVDYKKEYLSTVEDIIGLHKKLIEQETKLRQEAEKKLTQQKLLEQSLINTVHKYERFDIYKVSEMKDTDKALEIINKQKQYIQEVSKLQEEAGIKHIKQQELEKYNEELLQAEKLINADILIKRAEEETKTKILNLKAQKKAIEEDLKLSTALLDKATLYNKSTKENNEKLFKDYSEKMEEYTKKITRKDQLENEKTKQHDATYYKLLNDELKTLQNLKMPTLKLAEEEPLEELREKFIQDEAAIKNLDKMLKSVYDELNIGQEKAIKNEDILIDKMSKTVEVVNEMVKAFDNLVKVRGSVNIDLMNPVPKAQGGLIGYGRDNIPALLSAGEYVVNSASTRKFYSQLVAMNSGLPRFASGGLVGNTTVGDINVNLRSSGSEHVDVVRIGQLLRREIKKGTVTLN